MHFRVYVFNHDSEAAAMFVARVRIAFAREPWFATVDDLAYRQTCTEYKTTRVSTKYSTYIKIEVGIVNLSKQIALSSK